MTACARPGCRRGNRSTVFLNEAMSVRRRDFCNGSKADVMRSNRDVRFYPDSDKRLMRSNKVGSGCRNAEDDFRAAVAVRDTATHVVPKSEGPPTVAASLKRCIAHCLVAVGGV